MSFKQNCSLLRSFLWKGQYQDCLTPRKSEACLKKKGLSSSSSWHWQHSPLPKLNTVIALAGRGRLDSAHYVLSATHGHHLRMLPPMSSPSRAEESWCHAKAKVKAWLYGLVDSFSGEVNNGHFNPDTDSHTWSSKLLSPSWIKLPGNPWTVKMTLYSLQGMVGEELLPVTWSHSGVSLTFSYSFLRELKCCKCLWHRATGGRMLPAAELGIIGSSHCYKQPGRKLTSSLVCLSSPGSSKLEQNVVSCHIM